ncbi:RIMS-binding protein 2-like [Babylonia areolata]|uniref:RIMS-binding protein 2-like n=1 Tax=Babylonia areolata TaxID=304850 RepID=UPI003FD452B9
MLEVFRMGNHCSKGIHPSKVNQPRVKVTAQSYGGPSGVPQLILLMRRDSKLAGSPGLKTKTIAVCLSVDDGGNRSQMTDFDGVTCFSDFDGVTCFNDFDGVREECSTLRVTLAAAQTERESAKEQVSSLQTRVNSLENLVRDLQESAEQLQSLEHDYKDALSQLASKQHQIDHLQETQKESQAEHQKAVTDLQSQIRELEARCRTQQERQEELDAEVQTLRQQKQQRQQQRQREASPARRRASPATPGGIPPSDSADSGLPASGANSDEGVSQTGKGSEGHPALDLSAAPPDTSSKSHDTGFGEGDSTASSSYLSFSILSPDTQQQQQQRRRQTAAGAAVTLPRLPQLPLSLQRTSASKKTLLTTATPQSPASAPAPAPAPPSPKAVSECGDPELQEIAAKLRLLTAAAAEDSDVDGVDEEDWAKEPEDSGMESRKDTRFSPLAIHSLAVMSPQFSPLAIHSLVVMSPQFSPLAIHSLVVMSPQFSPLVIHCLVVMSPQFSPLAIHSLVVMSPQFSPLALHSLVVMSPQFSPLAIHSLVVMYQSQLQLLAKQVQFSPVTPFPCSHLLFVKTHPISQPGHIPVVLLQYAAHPKPPLHSYDHDGFFEGELTDGRRGLVPSNFIERVAEPGPSPLDSDNEDMADGKFGSGINGRVSKNILNNNNNSSACSSAGGPPRGLDGGSVQAYHVYLNGALKATLKGSERTKALLEDVDANQNHRISVRCLSNQGQSKDGQCTMLIGRDVLPVPTEVGVRSVTQSSACVSWMPGNSNHPHAVLLNGREAKVVPAGVCSHTLTGLAPSTVYRVTITTRPLAGPYGEKHKWSQDKVSCNIEFKTLVGGAVPDPPLNVQVEAGPREGTLLLTWLPVTINSSGFSNGAVVTGYVVYADGNRVKEAKGPTNDHMVLSREDFRGHAPKQLTVRTATVDHLESADSADVFLPHTLVRELSAATARGVAAEAMRAASARKSPKVSGGGGGGGGGGDQAGHETDEEIEAAFQEAESPSPEIETQIAEPFAETSSSELSDILEVEEELGGDDSNQNGDSSVANLPSQVEKARKSPKPAPRKVSPSVGPASGGDKEAVFGVKQFHGQKPDPSQKDGLLTTPMIVPAIEITRDSSTERGGSFEEDADGSHHRPTPPADSADSAVKRQQQPRQRSVEEGGDKPMPAHDPISQRYRSSGDEPSAFRSVEQGKQRGVMPDSYGGGKPRDSWNVTQRPGSGQGHGSAHSSPSHKAKDDRIHEGRHSASESAPPKPARRTPLESEEANDRDSITEEMTPMIDDSTVRLFIALFDYDPITMSPNVDCVDEELPFREGQILKVYGDKDADGFFRGEADGREGYIPCNMVSEIHIDDPELVEQLLKENQTNAQQSSSTEGKVKSDGHLTPNGVAPRPAPGPARRMVALYDYDPQELSPNVDSELELAFKQGDIIFITGEMDEDGFYVGELSGHRGLVPSNFLQDAPLSDEDEVLESASMVSPSRSQGSISAASRRSDSLSTLNNTSRKDRLSLSPPVERAIVLDAPSEHSPAVEEEKRKKKGGLLNKGRSILKKFSR